MRAWQVLTRRSLARSPASLPPRQLRGAATAATPESTLTPAMLTRARSIAASHTSLTSRLASAYDIALAKKAGDLLPTVNALKEYDSATTALDELNQLLSDPAADTELRDIAHDELPATTESLAAASSALKSSLVPQHPFAQMSCMLELRPGAGGSEAAIFTADLFRMYEAWCKRHRLRTNVLKADAADARGGGSSLSEAVLEIEGSGAYGLLRCEAGVHRVQRVPETETKGRTHTSAVSVLVLPNLPENDADGLGAAAFEDPGSDYYIDPKDVRTDVMRASGAGGQHVNKTESKVRLVHEPTNTVVEMQESRSQQKNREKAWKVLRAKLAQARREAREEEIASMRTSVIGVAKMGRGDKVRTYNWGQQRVTDHRSGITIHNLDDCVEGGEQLDQVMQSVRVWMSEQDLAAMIAEEEAADKQKEKEKEKDAGKGKR